MTVSFTNVSKNSISPSNTSKNSISPANVDKTLTGYFNLLMETSSALLLENSDNILLESTASAPSYTNVSKS